MKISEYTLSSLATLVIIVTLSFLSQSVYDVLNKKTTTQTAAVNDISGLVAHWTFDEGTGTSASDLAGGAPGVISGATWIGGKVGTGALQLDGVDDFISFGQPSSLDFSSTNAFTLSLWVYPGTAAKRVAFSRGGTFTSSGSEVFNLAKSNSYPDRWNAVVSDGINSIELGTGATTVFGNSWQHVVMVWDGSARTLSLYRDAQLIGSRSTTTDFRIRAGTGTTANTAAGKDALSNRYFWDGAMDDVRIYNRALQPSEISELFALGSSNTGTPPPSENHLTELYVSPAGNDANTGAASAPLLTLNKALQKVLPGDTIYLLAGTHTAEATTLVNGTADKPIKIKGAGPSQSIFVNRLNLRNSHYIVTDIKFQGNYVRLHGPTGTNITLSQNEITGGILGITMEGYDPQVPSHITISNNVFYQPQGTMLTLSGNGNLVTQNTFRDGGGWDAIHVWGRNQTISKNKFLRIIADQIASGGNHADIIQTWNSTDHAPSTGIVFEQNYIQDGTSQLGNVEGSDEADIGDWTFRNNVIINSRIQFNNTIPNVKVYNNTVYGTPAAYTNGFRFSTTEGRGSAAGGQVYNNIFIGDGGFYSYTSTNVIGDYNIISNLNGSAKTMTQKGAHEINGGFNPQDIFVNIAAGDFRLKSGSIAVNAGAQLGFNVDFEGNTRPQGGAWDIGAYESSYTGMVTEPPASVIPGDFDGDGKVTTLDWSYMNSKWNTNDAAADLNKDGKVNTLDFSILVRNWTPL